MSIIVDVLTKLDVSSLVATSKELEGRLLEAGKAASMSANTGISALDRAQREAALSAERLQIAEMKLALTSKSSADSALKMAQANHAVAVANDANERSLARLSATQVSSLGTLGLAAGAALGGITAVAAGTVAALVEVGEKFENINRQIVTTTGASGASLNQLNDQVRNVMSSVDTSVKSIGTDMGVLSNRLQLAGNDPALEKLTKHVEELQDRFGGLDVRALTAGFLQFGVSTKDYDDTLASLMNTAMATGDAFPALISNVQQFGEVLQQSGLNIEQSARFIGQMDALLGPGGASRAMLGFAHAEKDAADQGVTFQKFLEEAAQSIQAYIRMGDQASAQAMEQDIFGVRNWPQAHAIQNIFMDIKRAGSDAFKAHGTDIDDVSNRTRTLGNIWDEVRNKISAALATPGEAVASVVSGGLDRLLHGEPKAGAKGGPSEATEPGFHAMDNVMHAMDNVGHALGNVGHAFENVWHVVENVGHAFENVWHAVENVGHALGNVFHAFGGDIIRKLGWDLIKIAAHDVAVAFETLWHRVDAVWHIIDNLATGIGNFISGAWKSFMDAVHTVGDVIQHDIKPAFEGLGHILGDIVTAGGRVVDFFDKLAHPFGGGGHPATAPSAGPSPPTAPPHAAAAPGTPPPFTPRAGGPTYNWVPGQGYVAGPAAPSGPAAPTAPGIPDGGPPILSPDDLSGKNKRKRGLPKAPELPYGPEFTAPPLPGESESHYAARGSVLEKQHKVAEDRARLKQLEKANTATAEDIQKARNKLDQDIRSELEARKSLQENEARQLKKHTDTLKEFGVKIDNDFGISKGLPGIAENIFKFLAGLVSAPIIGAAQGFNATQGGPTFGAKGLIGTAALGGAFGSQFTPEGMGQGAGTGFSGVTSGIASGIGSPEELSTAGGRVGALFGLAQSLVGTPYSQKIRNDCSGMVNELAATAVGLPIPTAAQRFNTTNEGQWLQSHGFQMGTPPPEMANQSFQVGWNPAPGNSGHTAATLPGGVNAEQGGSNSQFTLGPGAAGANSPQFPLHAWLSLGAQSGQGGPAGNLGPSGAGTAPSVFSGGGGPHGGPEAAAYQAMIQAGFGPDQWPALKNIITRESGFNPSARNPGSGAYGMYQFLGHQGDKYGQMGGYSPDPAAQSVAGMQYIKDRYSNPSAAWDHWQQAKSYDGGGEIDNSGQNFYDWLAKKPLPPSTSPSEALSQLPGVLKNQYTDNPLSHNAMSTGKKTMVRAIMQDPGLSLPGFAAGGDIQGKGAIPIMAHEGEHVLTKSDVQALGGHDGVYKMRSNLHQSPTMQYLSDASSDKSGPQSPLPKSSADKLLPPGVMSAMPKIVQGGHQPGPSMIGTIAPPAGYGGGFAITGGGLIGLAESLPSTAASMGMMGAGAAQDGGAVDNLMGGMPGGTAPAMPAPAAPAPPPAMGAPGGSSAGGAKASGGSPSGSISSALIGIGIQEMNAAIGAAGQATGALVGGLQQTFGPGQFAQSKLAQSGWVNKVIGGITGAQPQLPNMAGQTHQGGSLTPEQAASAAGGAPHLGGEAPGPGGPSSSSGGPLVQIENYHVTHTEDRAGQDLARQMHAGATNSLTGSR